MATSDLEQLSIASMERRQLQDKLQQLQQTKHQMDSVLHELHSLRSNRLMMNNGGQMTKYNSLAVCRIFHIPPCTIPVSFTVTVF